MEKERTEVVRFQDHMQVDRSVAYVTCHIENLVAAGVVDEILVQAYAIGVVKPMGIFIETYGTSKVI